MSENRNLSCPYCGENIELFIDDSVGDQEYIEDCSVCCRPIVVVVSVDLFNGASTVSLKHENE